MESELLKKINWFGPLNQKNHLKGEFEELEKAFIDYLIEPSNENLLHLLEELSDCMVLAKQLALKAGITLEEIDAIQPDKINRTIDIIDRSDPSKDKLEEYNRLRRG